jgi:hypothetical protein
MALYDNRNPNLAIAQQDQLFDRAFSWEPKRQHHFILSIPDIPAYLVKTSDKPKIANNEVALDMINIKRYVKGKSEWNTISMTLYDAIVPSGAQAVMEWIRLHHESLTGRDGYSSDYKRDVELYQLTALGEKIGNWTLKGTYILDANFGQMDWGTEDAVTIELTLKYDYAIHQY